MAGQSSGSGSRGGAGDGLESKLRLEVLDVTSTAVALSVFTPPLQTTTGYTSSTPAESTTTAQRRRSPIISIQLDRQPWPHVAHAGSLSQEATTAGARGAETTVIVYGLVSGREYEISLDVSSGEGQDGEAESEHFSLEVETGQEPESRPSSEHENAADEDAPASPATATPQPSTPAQSSLTEANTPDHPPPPYSAEPSREATSSASAESQLRALLKKLRASSKRTEGVLNASVNALKKSVEKGLKEDQRARTRIGGLEEAVRKADEAALVMRTSDRDNCEQELLKLEELEEQVKQELAQRKEGNGPSQQAKSAPTPAPAQVKEEEDQPEEDQEAEAGQGIAELARELDGLNKMIDELESESKTTEDHTLKTLETDLTTIEADLVQMDREEAHHRRMYAGGNRSSDSFERVDPLRAPPPLAPIASSGGFNLRWRKNANQAPAGLGPPPQQDPRSFGRFFRRNVSDPPQQVPPPSSMDFSVPPSDGRFNAQQYAQQYQQMWAPPSGMPPMSAAYSTNSRSSSLSRGRPRSGSLNSVHSGNMPYGGSNLGPSGGNGFYRTNSNEFHELSTQSSRHSATTPLSPLVPLPESIPIPLPSSNGKGEKEKGNKLLSSSSGSKDKEVVGSSGSGGTSWGRLGNWSQVVGKGKRPQTPKDKDKDKKSEEKLVKEE